MPDNKFRVAVMGDSVMWGQGLKTENKFYFLAANEIARSLGKELEIVAFTARSGAKLQAAGKDRPLKEAIDATRTDTFGTKIIHVRDHRDSAYVEITLPSGGKMKTAKGDRVNFYDTYPAFFQTDDQVRAFLDGSNEEPSRDLYGEIPATFPTITYQINSIDAQVAQSIDLVLLDSGVNDVDFEDVLDSMDGSPLGKIELRIRFYVYEELKKTLVKLRRQFSNAVIMFTGYFSPFSRQSSRSKIEELAKYRSDKSDFMIGLNDVVTSIPGGDFIPGTVDVEQKVGEAIYRSEFAHVRGLYWLRRTITEVYNEGSKVPGLYFVHPGFQPENSLFAANSFLHEGYQSTRENGAHWVNDAVLQERVLKIPRYYLFDAFKNTIQSLNTLAFALGQQFGPSTEIVENMANQLGVLLAQRDVPNSVHDLIRALLSKPIDRSRIDDIDRLIARLKRETGRIHTAEIASFVHPNELGAKRYADRIVERYKRHRQLSVKNEMKKLQQGGQQQAGTISVKQSLKRYGLDRRLGLRACLQHMIVDSIAIDFKPISTVPFLSIGFLNLGGELRFLLSSPFAKYSPIDTFGTLHLGDIKELTFEIVETILPGPDFVDFQNFRLWINGSVVFESTQQHRLKVGGKVTFDYPFQV